MFGFGKKAREAKQAIQKVHNIDLMQAIIAGSIWIASADGELEVEELERIEAICLTNDALSHFQLEIPALIDKYKMKFERVGAAVIRHEAKKEISDLKNVPDQAAECFVNLIAVAQADGEIEPAEQKALEEIGRLLGLRVEDFA